MLKTLNFITISSMSFYPSFYPCNCLGHLAVLYFEKLIDFHFQKSPDFWKGRFLAEVPYGLWNLHPKRKYSRIYINTSPVSSSSSSSDEEGQERFLHQGRCRTHCPRGLYPDRGHYACLPCIANCELCTDGNICAKCREHYKLLNGVCQMESCVIGKCKV